MRATRAIIHLDNLKYNIQQIKKIIKPEVKICLPIKADAYGHGAIRIAVAAIRAGVSYFAVASVQEAIELRNAGIITPIISLSLPILEEIPTLLKYDIEPLVIDEEFINNLNYSAKKLNKIAGVHLKIDTGMNRIGCTPDEALKLAVQIDRSSNLKLKGIATHFAVSESQEKTDIEYTKNQIKIFKETIKEIKKAKINTGIIHASNSGAVLQYPEAQFDMIRPGLLIYGYPPSNKLKSKLKIKPIMELISQVVLIKKIKKGTSVSYGRKWTSEKDTYIATLPIGYADGLPRSLSPGLKVKIGDEFFPIVGTICMDQCMVNIGSKPWVQRWEKVHIFGANLTDKHKYNSAYELGQISGLIPYELTCGINKRVPRVYVE